MFLTVTCPLRVYLADREVSLKPGRLEHLHLTDKQVDRLVARLGPGIRLLRVGSIVAWNSPLFGRCEAPVGMLPEGNWIGIKRHPITEEPLLLPCSWITEIVSNE
jgi:hypothetical protein